jgi:hypothetical protein
MGTRWLGVLTVGIIAGLGAPDTEAVPAYARKHEIACSQCHSAWPLLNKFGRTFKENGYRLDREPDEAEKAKDVEIDERTTLAKMMPMSVRFQGRPIVKSSTDDRFNMQVIHEVEVEITDAAPKDFSYYINFEAADDGDWAVELVDVVAGWHPKQVANLVGGYSRMGFTDGYNTFASRRLTQDRPSPNSAGFQSSYRFRDATPFVSFYGRAKGLFYSATVGTGRDDFVGNDLKDYMLRAVYDFEFGKSVLSVGGFTLIGERELAATATLPVRTQGYDRTGFDVQFEGAGVTANAAWFQAKEDLATTLVEQKNDAWYVQALYVPKLKIPLVPVLRFESVESANGAAQTQQFAAALLAYVRGNINLSFDYITQTKVPPGASKTHRYSVLAIFAF